MKTSHLLEHFDRISEASDAIPKLRKLVLDLAVRGRLVEQDADDQPASKLLMDLRAAKSIVIRGANSRHLRATTAEIDPIVDRPFPIPAQWSWCRLSDVGAIIGGGTPPSGEQDNFTSPGEGIPWVTPADLGRQRGLYVKRGTRDLTPQGKRESSATLLPMGSVLFTSRAPIGYTAIAANDISTNQGFKSVVPYLMDCHRYVEVYLRAFTARIEAMASGTTFREVSGRVVAALTVPLPPLAEQGRIVAKVDELMALCDELEVSKASREDQRERQISASLYRLSNRAHTAGRASDVNLDFMNSVKGRQSEVLRLRQTIVSLAVSGRLLNQAPDDEPAADIVRRIQAENRTRLPRRAAVASPSKEPARFGIPRNWCWVTLGEISAGLRYGTSVKCSYGQEGVAVLRIPNIKAGRIISNDLKYGDLQQRERDELRLELGDILMIRSNGSLDLVGRPGMVEPESVGYCYAGYLVRVRTSPEHLVTRYLILALGSEDVRDQIETPIRTTVGLKNVNSTELSRLAFPLPPKAEQQRIVAKVDELMAICDELELAFDDGNRQNARLLDAVIDEALTSRVRQQTKLGGTLLAFQKISEPTETSPTPRISPQSMPVPIIGRIAAGVLTLAEQHVDGWFQIPKVMLKPADGTWCVLRVSGNSMNLAEIDQKRIEDGDFLLVRGQDAPEAGKIVVAEFEGEAVLKRYVNTAAGAVLRAESTGSYPDIAIEPGFRVQGVVLANLKSGSEFERTDEQNG